MKKTNEKCIEFYQNTPYNCPMTAMYVSARNIELVDIFLNNRHFSLKKDAKLQLAYSREKEKFYIRIEIKSAVESNLYYLEIDREIRSLLIPKGSMNPQFLDHAIKAFHLRTHFSFADKQLKFFIQGKNGNWANYEIAIDEDTLDVIFIHNPSIVELVLSLKEQADYPIIKEILPFLEHGMLNSARQIMIGRQNELGECDPELRELLIKELFGKHGIRFKNKKYT